MYLATFLDPAALGLVFGGTALVAAARSTGGDCKRAIAALGPLVRARADADAQAARVAVNRIVERSQIKGIASADRAPVVERFLARVAARLADTHDAAAFAEWAETDLADRAERHAAAQDVWRAAAEVAPAMGMIGTVLGLIGMFARMDDAAAIGPGMALALTTTLYGVIVANVIAAPVAARLERLSRAELGWQREAVDRLATLAREELGGEARLRAVA